MLFVTSFNKSLARHGSVLVRSFLEHRSGRLLVCYEDQCTLPPDAAVARYCLDDDAFLHAWLRENSDVIPLEYGGKAVPCRCRNRRRHWRGCPYGPRNRRASRWFRKIASLLYARDAFCSCRYLLWIDCDCVFKRSIPHSFVESLFQQAPVLYLQGERRISETGFIGFDLASGGGEFLDSLVDRYVSRKYLQDYHWDDSCQFDQTRISSNIKCVDIAGATCEFYGSPNCVFPNSLLGDFVAHYKGIGKERRFEEARVQGSTRGVD